MSSPTIIYRIDAADRLVFVNDAWDAFALANDGARTTSAHVLGRPLWGFIADPTTRELYERVLGRIRSGNVLRFTFRCDSPACRRVMEMRVLSADAEGGIEFRSVTLAEDYRQTPATVQWGGGESAAADNALQRVCGWCNRFDVAGVWLEVEEALPKLRLLERASAPHVTHAICETCFATMTTKLALADHN